MEFLFGLWGYIYGKSIRYFFPVVKIEQYSVVLVFLGFIYFDLIVTGRNIAN